MDFAFSAITNLFSNQVTIALAVLVIFASIAALYFIKRWMSKEPIQSIPASVMNDVSASLHPDGPDGPDGSGAESAPAPSESVGAETNEA